MLAPWVVHTIVDMSQEDSEQLIMDLYAWQTRRVSVHPCLAAEHAGDVTTGLAGQTAAMTATIENCTA